MNDLGIGTQAHQVTRLEIKQLKQTQDILSRLASQPKLEGALENDVVRALQSLRTVLRYHLPPQDEALIGG